MEPGRQIDYVYTVLARTRRWHPLEGQVFRCMALDKSSKPQTMQMTIIIRCNDNEVRRTFEVHCHRLKQAGSKRGWESWRPLTHALTNYDHMSASGYAVTAVVVVAGNLGC